LQSAGIAAPAGDDQRFYVADVVLTCAPLTNTPLTPSPKLIVEILSPSTEGIDKKRKVPDYSAVPSVEEIWLIESRYRWVVVWQKIDGTWIGSLPFTGEHGFQSRVLGLPVQLDELYYGVAL
jgi:Uma2 family endonuclease